MTEEYAVALYCSYISKDEYRQLNVLFVGSSDVNVSYVVTAV